MTTLAERPADYRPRQDRTGQPLAQVDCTGCGLRFTSAAKTHTNCPRCRRNLRVHRAPIRRAAAVPARSISAPAVRQPSPRPTQSPAETRPSWPATRPDTPSWPSASPSPRCRLEAAEDDEVYLRESGRLVLAVSDGTQLAAAETLPIEYLARELPARGWYLWPHGADVCAVVRTWPAVADYPAAAEPCQRPAEHGQLCRKCFEALRTPA